MEAKKTLNKVRTILGMDVSLETRKLENGTMLEAEDFSKGNEVFILADDSEKIALPQGDYTLEDGLVLSVIDEGIIDEVREQEKEAEEKEEEKVEEAEELGEDRGKDDDEVAVDDWEGMEKRIKNLEDAVADLKSRVGKDEEEIKEEFTSQAKEIELNDIEPIAHSPEKANAKRETFGQTRRYANGTQARVFQALFGDNN